MSLKTKFIVAVIVVLALVWYLIASFAKPQSNPAQEIQSQQQQGPQMIKKDDQAGLNIQAGGATMAERQALKNKAYEAMSSLAKSTNDSDALKVAEFFKVHAKLAEPVLMPEKIGYRVFEKIKDANDFFFIPMSEKDKNLKGFEPYFRTDEEDSGIAGSYEPATNAMFFPLLPAESTDWQAIYLMHETWHAMKYRAENYNWKDTTIFCYKELETYKFQFRVTEKLFGKDYTAFVDQKADELFTKISKDGSLGKTWPGTENVLPLPEFLDTTTTKEQNLVMTSVWLDVMFRLVDRHFTDTPEKLDNQKARIYYGLCLKIGIFKSDTE